MITIPTALVLKFFALHIMLTMGSVLLALMAVYDKAEEASG